MKKGNLILMALAVGLLLALVGCSSGDNEAANPPAEAAAQVAEAHDCDGGCGMTAVPMDKLTEVNGKFYCAGCAAKAKAEAGTDEEGHEGHGHG